MNWKTNDKLFRVVVGWADMVEEYSKNYVILPVSREEQIYLVNKLNAIRFSLIYDNSGKFKNMGAGIGTINEFNDLVRKVSSNEITLLVLYRIRDVLSNFKKGYT